MRIKAIQNFITEQIPDGTAGMFYTVSDAFGRHLVEAGVAIEMKVESAPESKADPLPKFEAARPSSASQPDPVSPQPIATPRRGRPRKSSQ